MPAYSRSGTVATGTTTVTATCPTCLVGDILVLQVETNGTAATTPTGWTIQSVLTLAQRRQAVYTKLAIASDEAGTATYAVAGLTGGTTSAAQIHVITTSTPSSTLAVTAPTVGTDTSITTTAYSATGASQVRTTGALLVCPFLVTSTTAVLTGVTATALTGTGGTVATSTNRAFTVGGGGLFGIGLQTAPVTTGGTGAPKMALNGTGSATVGGVSHFLNITETPIPVGLATVTTLGLVTQQTSNKVIALAHATTLTAVLPTPATTPVLSSAGTYVGSGHTGSAFNLVVTCPPCAVGDLLILNVLGLETSTTLTSWGTPVAQSGVPAGLLIQNAYAKYAVAADVGGTQTYTIPMNGGTDGAACIYVVKGSTTGYQAQVLEGCGGSDDSGPTDNLISFAATGEFQFSNNQDLVVVIGAATASNMSAFTLTNFNDNKTTLDATNVQTQSIQISGVSGDPSFGFAYSADVVAENDSLNPGINGTCTSSPTSTNAVAGAVFLRITEYPIPELVNYVGKANGTGGNPSITISDDIRLGESIYIVLFSDDGGGFGTPSSILDNSAPGYTWTALEGHVDANNNTVVIMASEVVPYATPGGITIGIGQNAGGTVSGSDIIVIKTVAGAFLDQRSFHTGTNDTSGSPPYNKSVYGNALTPSEANAEHIAYWFNAGDGTTVIPYHGWHELERFVSGGSDYAPATVQSMRQSVAVATKAIAGAITSTLFSGYHTILKPPPTPAYLQHVTIQVPQNGTTVHACDPSNATGGGTVVGGAAFTPTAGKFLLAVCYGQVTFTTPTKAGNNTTTLPVPWTLPTNGSAVNNGGLYVFYLASAVGGDTFATTQNGSNFPVVFDVYEFEAGTTFDVCASSTGVSVGSAGAGAGAGPTLTKSSSPSTVMSAVGGAISTTTGSNYFDWDNGFTKTADNYFTPLGNGYVFSVTEGDGITSTSLSDSASQNATMSTLGTAERLIWSLTPGTGGGGTETGIVGLAVATTLAAVPVDTLQPVIGLAVATTLGLTPQVEHDATVGLATATTLGVVPSTTHQATVAIAAATTLAAVPVDTLQPTIALTAATALGVVASHEADATVALAAATAIAVTPKREADAVVALAAATILSATASHEADATVALAAATVLGVVPLRETDAVVALAAATTLVPITQSEKDATVALAAATTLGAVPVDTLQPVVALAAATALALTPLRETDATVALAAATVLALTAVPTHQALAALAAQTILAVTPVPTHQGSINLAAATSLIVNVQTVYYVSAAGSDSNDGLTTTTPYLTIGKVNSKTLHAGDSVLFRGGDTFSDALLHLTGVGSTINPITIGSYGTGKATLSFGTNNAVFVDGVGGYVFSNLNFTGISGSTGFAGVNCFTNGTGVRPALTFDACSFTGWQTGLQIGGESATDGYNGITIDSCDFSGNLYGGCSIFNVAAFVYTSPVYAHSNVSITNSTFDNNTGDASVTTIGTGSGLNVASVDGGVVTGCEAHGNGANNGDTTSGPVGIWVSESNNVVVSNCLAYSNHSGTSVDGDGFDLDQDCTNCVVEYCLSYGNDGAGILLYGGFSDNGWANNTARYNVTFGNGQTNSSYSEMTLGGLIIGAQVYGNTCISKDSGTTFPSPLLLQYSPGMTSCAIRNNLFYGTGFGDLAYDGVGGTTSQVEMQGNLYFSPHTTTIHWGTDYTSLSAWQAATGQEKLSGSAIGLMTDPKLVAPTTGPTVTSAALITGYTSAQLQAASPAFGAGLDLQTLFSINPGLRDFYNNTLATPLPIGADDHVPVVSVTVGLAVVTTLGVVAKRETDATVGLATVTTLGVVPHDTLQPAIALAAATALAVVPQVTYDAVALLAAATTLSATPTHEADAAVTLAAATSLLLTPSHEADAVVGLAAATSLSVTPQRETDAAVAIVAATTLGVVASHEADATALLGAATTLSLVVQHEADAAVTLAALTTLALTPSRETHAVVALAAATVLLVVQSGTLNATIELDVATTLSVAPQVTYQAVIALAAATTLLVLTQAERDATVAIAAATTLNATTQSERDATVALAAATVLSLTPVLERDGTVLLAAATALSATPLLTHQAAITLAAATVLGVVTQVTYEGTVLIGAATALSTTVLVTHQAAVALAAQTVLGVVQGGTETATVSLAAATVLSLTVLIEHDAVVAFAALTALSLTPSHEADATITLAVATVLSAAALVEHDRAVALVVATTVSLTPLITHQVVVAIAAATTLTAIIAGERDATMTLAAATALSLAPSVVHDAVVALVAASTLNVTPLRETDAVVLLAAATVLGALGVVERDELVLLATTTALTAITQGERDAAVALATLTALTLVPHAQLSAIVPLAVQTVLNLIASVLPPQRAFLAYAVVGIRALDPPGPRRDPSAELWIPSYDSTGSPVGRPEYGRGPFLESNDFGD